MQNGSLLYYFKQVIVADDKGKRSRRVRLMQVDLSRARKLQAEQVEVNGVPIETAIVDDPKAPEY